MTVSTYWAMNMSGIAYILLPLQKLAKIKVSTPIGHMIMSTYDKVFLYHTYSTLAINCIQCFSQIHHIVLPFKLNLDLSLFSKSSLLYKGFFRAFIYSSKDKLSKISIGDVLAIIGDSMDVNTWVDEWFCIGWRRLVFS